MELNKEAVKVFAPGRVFQVWSSLPVALDSLLDAYDGHMVVRCEA